MLAVASGYWRTKALIYLGGEGGLRTKYWYSAVTWRRDHQKLSGSLSWSSAGGRRPAIMWWFVLTRSSELFVLCSLLVQIALARSVNWGHPHRSSALDGAAAALTVACTRVMVLVSQSSGLSEGGCPEQSRYFGPHPVRFKRSVVFVGVDGAAHRAWPFL